MTHVSLFAGIDGIGLAAERAGFETVLQVEPDRACIRVLEREWPNVRRIKTVQELIERLSEDQFAADTITLISGGDPCPCRSRARGNRPTKHPDLSGYFLAVVGKMRPGWVLRENVPAPDVVDFETALDVLGYRAIIVVTNAAPYTGQRRIREFVVGCPSETGRSKIVDILERQCGKGVDSTECKNASVVPCLATHPKRYGRGDCFVYEGRLRVFDSLERARFAGFPDNWLEGLGHYTVARLTGNAVVPAQVYPILQAIADVERGAS